MKYFCLSDIGLKREINQDSYCAIKNENGDLLALVCDGIGGGKAGDVASGEAVKYFINDFPKSNEFKTIDDVKNYINESLIKCNNDIYQLSTKYKEYLGMGTTLTGILITNIGVISMNIGDSRVYGFKNGNEYRLTNDHTLVNEMLQKGEVTPEEALNHPKRHYLTRALGVWDKVNPDINDIENMDYYLICSDGLYNCINDNEINSIMTTNTLNPEEKANKLLEKSLLNGGYDNITIIVVDCINE